MLAPTQDISEELYHEWDEITHLLLDSPHGDDDDDDDDAKGTVAVDADDESSSSLRESAKAKSRRVVERT